MPKSRSAANMPDFNSPGMLAAPACMAANRPLWRTMLPAGLLLVGALLALPLDGPLAHWTPENSRLDVLGGVLSSAEQFGNGIGITFILLAVLLLDPVRRGYMPRVVALSLGGGLMANLVKLLVARLRPYQWMLLDKESLSESWIGWLPLGMNRGAEQSFPSAHTAAAVGLAIALVWLYPRGRSLFVSLAVLVGMQRIAVDAHFASDVLAGAAVGWLTAVACFRVPGLNAIFTRWEAGSNVAAVSEPVHRVASRAPNRRSPNRQRRLGSITLRLDPPQRGLPK